MVRAPELARPTFSDLDTVTLRTVGIDIGSATSHLMFAEVVMARLTQELSSRFVAVDRRVVWTSPVLLTPYSDEGDTIDSSALRRFVERCAGEAGVDSDTIDSGAVLLTGTALHRRNARAIVDELAELAGDFVCAAAGHHLEAILAAHGSGAVERSEEDRVPVVNVDIGGGTTKVAVCQDGRVTGTAAIAVGSRLVAWDHDRRLIRLEPSALDVAERAGVALRPGGTLTEEEGSRLASTMADLIVSALTPDPGPGAEAFALTPPAALPGGRWELVLSGGAMEWLVTRADGCGDLGPALAEAVVDRLRSAGLDQRLMPARQRLRATVVGASQFSTQVSGTTIHLGDPDLLPAHALPVVALGDIVDAPDEDHAATAVGRALDTRAAGGPPLQQVALSLRWHGAPAWSRIRPVAEGIRRAVASRPQLRMVVLVVDADLSATFGRILISELGWQGPSLVCLDGLETTDLDYLDIGRPSVNGGACPVVIKSLLFAPPDVGADTHRRPPT